SGFAVHGSPPRHRRPAREQVGRCARRAEAARDRFPRSCAAAILPASIDLFPTRALSWDEEEECSLSAALARAAFAAAELAPAWESRAWQSPARAPTSSVEWPRPASSSGRARQPWSGL